MLASAGSRVVCPLGYPSRLSTAWSSETGLRMGYSQNAISRPYCKYVYANMMSSNWMIFKNSFLLLLINHNFSLGGDLNIQKILWALIQYILLVSFGCELRFSTCRIGSVFWQHYFCLILSKHTRELKQGHLKCTQNLGTLPFTEPVLKIYRTAERSLSSGRLNRKI